MASTNGTGKPQAEHQRVAAFAVSCVVWAQHIRDWLGYSTIKSVGYLDDAFPLIEGYELVLRWERDGEQLRCRHEVRRRSDAG